MTTLAALLKRTPDEAAHDAATSDLNILRKPTEKQIAAGVYRKGHTTISGLRISIENAAGTYRRPEWPVMKAHYGYIKGTLGADGDHVDCFINPGTAEDWEGEIYVIDQLGADGLFDEHKCMIGYDDSYKAEAAYSSHYPDDWIVGPISIMTIEEFKEWLQTDTTKPLHEGLHMEGNVARKVSLRSLSKATSCPSTRVRMTPSKVTLAALS